METKTNNDYTRRNRFTGESIELTKEEAEKHDKIFYHEALATLEDKELGTGASKHWQKMRDLLVLVYEEQCQSIHGLTRLNINPGRPAGAQGSLNRSQLQVVSHPTP